VKRTIVDANRRRTAAILTLSALVVAAALPVAAQEPDVDSYLELLRSDIKTEKVAVMTEAMALTTEQSEAFWPLYREFQTELAKIGDKRIALIKNYAENFDTMTAEKASEIAKEWFDQQNKRLKLLKKYHGKVAKAVGPVEAVRFMQVENTLQQLIDVQLSANMPLIR
jgi:hypothetical protein